MKLSMIRPVTELKRDAASLIEIAGNERTPIAITQKGKVSAVLVDFRTYEEDQKAFAILKLAIQGDSYIAHGRGLSYQEHRKRLDRALARAAKK